MQNGLRGRKIAHQGRALVSLADMVGGTKGRLVHNLLGKRVDYSAIAHCVPVPTLAPDRVRIPRVVAGELFRPWTYGALEAAGYVSTIRDAKRLVEADDPRARDALARVTHDYPIVMFAAESSAPAKIVSLDVELWDAPAFGLAPSVIAALGVAHGAPAVLHVPVDPRAVQEARTCVRREAVAADASAATGWIARASGAKKIDEVLVAAALRGELDPVVDARARRILGRPSDR